MRDTVGTSATWRMNLYNDGKKKARFIYSQVTFYQFSLKILHIYGITFLFYLADIFFQWIYQS